VLELVIELWQYSNDKGVRTQAMLLTRNLCFYGPTKTLLAANGNVQYLHYAIKQITFVYCREFLDATAIWIEVTAG